MASRLVLAGALLVAISFGQPTTAQQAMDTDLASYVDPFIGTAPAPSAAYGLEFDGGDVFPGAAYPTGMLFWSPDTVEHRMPGGYAFPDHTIKGFSLTHFSGRGCTVYQDVPIMPMTGPLTASPQVQPAQQQQTFSHETEHAQPGYYAVTLDSGIKVELAVTQRTGAGAITFPANTDTATLTINAGGSVNEVFDSQAAIDSELHLIRGSVESQVGCGSDHYRLYFAIAFDHAFADYGTWEEDRLEPANTVAHAQHAGAFVSFDTSNNPRVLLKPAISYVSVANALANLEAENPGWDLRHVRDSARQAWNDTLSKIQVSGGQDTNPRAFYTALYHAFLHPNLFSDVNGEYIGFDDRIQHVPPGHAHFHNIPGWDQYRSRADQRHHPVSGRRRTPGRRWYAALAAGQPQLGRNGGRLTRGVRGQRLRLWCA
jgi:predicted alpha-1,2-mannosidase